MLKSSMSLTPFLGQDLTAYRIDNTVYSITYRHRIRQRKPFHKNPLSKRLLSQLLTGDPEQVQRLAPSFSQSMGISLHKGCSHLRPWCAHGIFRSRKSRQSVFFPSSRPTLKKDSRHLRVAAFCIERQQMSDPALQACQKSDASLLAISRRSLLLRRTKLTSDVSRPVRAGSDFLPYPPRRPGRVWLRLAPSYNRVVPDILYDVGGRGSCSVCGTRSTKNRQNTLFSYGTTLTL